MEGGRLEIDGKTALTGAAFILTWIAQVVSHVRRDEAVRSQVKANSEAIEKLTRMLANENGEPHFITENRCSRTQESCNKLNNERFAQVAKELSDTNKTLSSLTEKMDSLRGDILEYLIKNKVTKN
ncbi:hypothetical protein [Desulforhopalus singaporensis]|uniref:Uncharacterized protein n=1 Tax=Desulforhopalus singaporensis TaxID=91360 RepID=A0A1H0UV51_9BACT|nr:hypothetical protein [Desulforhopalus singaporensis]SDP69981.1 hypothetical protein SAMN05660330_03737 [Desulforhopalus singaporensis]